ncbi:hypothetical protein TCAL_05671 [Tigriopus californicus]|uniref:Tudor domain-containing protein n=1 Tax=Tigriopus californicus TaxID=6832 RepID=A0A553PAR8_TIGCA|nr:KH domain-containing protein akap-1-like isoform X2 [Tigriopus californicus]XP_059097811.1 KH domain-containing protein akap-1-like isoform X2 [Tigriopus californicus]XP_059097820.1 KH domain-containing protein akap-1-like isoform X2 [Tigriopus californicus]TRY74764.1 hypothetical protein TCAL_05671 [Tigriopus californicus]|eukprot:TCALIF_05671-PB protein Name:"Similar to C56G2.1/C56G2.2 KH domain-containing protein C56G2.1 (Caenorhabditis elegans)" AED:0.07 eAED:0.07 QI:611/1/1/1/0.85/0.75/8/1050/493
MKPKKRLDEEQLSCELSKLNIHPEAMTKASIPEGSVVKPSTDPVKSSAPAEKSDTTPTSNTTATAASTGAASSSGRTHPDSGVVSPCEGTGSSTPVSRMVAPAVPGQTKTRSNSTDGGLGGSLCGEEEAETGSTEGGQALSDSGQGSETDEQSANHVVSFHFHVPNWLCGKFIGLQGSVIKQFKTASNCTITLKAQSNSQTNNSTKNHKHHSRHHQNNDQHGNQVCIIDGTRVNIEKCLQMIRDKFPLEDYPELSLEQVNCPLEDPSNITTSIVSPQQALATGIMQELVVSAIINGGCVSLQLPNNFYFSSLEQLTTCMYHTYYELDTPSVPRPVVPNVLCVAAYENQWYRVQVISYDSETDSCDARFVDFGGFDSFQGVDLRQIRTDFTTLPFQATDCYLSNVMPSDGEAWSPESATVLHELISSKACSGRMVGYAADGSPFVELYVTETPSSSSTKSPTEPVLVNRTLVDRGVASWVEHEVLEEVGEALEV